MPRQFVPEFYITDDSHRETSLTSREREVIEGLSKDQTVKMIAEVLRISPFTVQDHIKNIKQKLDVHTPGGIVAQAFREGLIS